MFFMSKTRFLWIPLATLLYAGGVKPPATPTEPVTDTVHGVKITDPYRWLEDQDSPRTRAWLKQQMDHADAVLREAPNQQKIHARLEELMRYDQISPPTPRGSRYFFTKRPKSADQPLLYMREGLNGKDELILDPSTLSPDKTVSAGFNGFSNDGRLICIGIRKGGEDETTLTFWDIDKRQRLPEELPRARYSGVLIPVDRKGIYYSKFTPDGPRAYFHAFNTDPSADKQIFGSQYGTRAFIGLGLSNDERWLTASMNEGVPPEKTEVFVLDRHAANPEFRPIITGIKERFGAAIRDGILYSVTSWKAPNSRILAIDLANPAQSNWREVVPESKWAIDGLTLAGKRLYISYLENAVPTVRVFDVSGKALGAIPPPRMGSLFMTGGQWEKDEAFYSFTSFAEAASVYRLISSKNSADMFWGNQPPVDPAQFDVRQVWYESKDKTKVPMFLFHKKGLQADGNRPVLLTGYGGFNASESPSYRAQAVVFAEMGGIVALPNLRGGGEFGEAWHRAGMFENKQNVFDDFIAAAEYLIANRCTRPAKIAISGGSNGGLLVGAAMTQRPDLFGAVVCQVPLLDMVRYHKFKVARWWTTEYGSAEDPQQFAYIYKYSPYHNVKPGTKYPAVMFTTGDSDTRVDPLHARKMTALVQAATGSDKPVILYYDTKSGRSGGLPAAKMVEDATKQLAFILWQLGAGN